MTSNNDAVEKRIILSIRNLNKSFGHIQALKAISLDIHEGEVLALVGDNGAGKSTLIKILSGVYRPDDGQIYLKEKSFKRLTPAQAIMNGITTVYQDLALVDCRDVACNVFLGREPTRARFFIDKKKMQSGTSALLAKLKIHAPVLTSPASILSGGQRQGIAIARAINQGGRILILDEPTAAMGVAETSQVLELVGSLGRQGYAVILVSHNLHQVFSVADRIIVMRNGQLIADLLTEETCSSEVMELITGIRESAAYAAKDVARSL